MPKLLLGALFAVAACFASASALAAAHPKVVMYATKTCGYCAKARAYFTERGVPWEERDIETSAQAARELLLLQSSDWQFIISTGAVADYGIRRFNGHADACDRLFGAIEAGLATGDLTSATNLARELRAQDDLFPNVLDSVGAVLKGDGRQRRAGDGKREAGDAETAVKPRDAHLV